MSEGPGGPEAGEVAEASDERDPFKRRVAVTIATLAVLGGFISLLETDAGNAESTTARETTRTGIRALSASVTENAVLGLDLDVAAEQAALAAGATFAEGPDTIESLAGLERAERQEDDDLAAAIAGLESGDEAAERGESLAVEAERLSLKQGALAETRVTWNARASQYGTVLTTLGVAIFLVGFTLVLSPRIRPPVLVPGLVLAAYCLGWALYIHQREVPDTPDEAIVATAEGTAAIDDGAYAAAVEDLDRAVAADADYEVAYARRSVARFLEANPDYLTSGAVVDTESAAFDQARQDAERSVALSERKGFLGLYLLGIQQFYTNDYEAAVESLEEAVEVNDVVPEALLLQASAHVGLGDVEAARRSFDRALGLLSVGEASQRNRLLVSDLFDQLEHVAFEDDDRAGVVTDLEHRLARAEAELVFRDLRPVPEADLAAAEVVLDDLAYADGELSATARWSGLPEDSQVSIYVFERPGEGEPWVQSFDTALFRTLSGSGSQEGSVETARTCAPVGFRVDVYVEGELLSSETQPGGDPTC